MSKKKKMTASQATVNNYVPTQEDFAARHLVPPRPGDSRRRFPRRRAEHSPARRHLVRLRRLRLDDQRTRRRRDRRPHDRQPRRIGVLYPRLGHADGGGNARRQRRRRTRPGCAPPALADDLLPRDRADAHLRHRAIRICRCPHAALLV